MHMTREQAMRARNRAAWIAVGASIAIAGAAMWFATGWLKRHVVRPEMPRLADHGGYDPRFGWFTYDSLSWVAGREAGLRAALEDTSWSMFTEGFKMGKAAGDTTVFYGEPAVNIRSGARNVTVDRCDFKITVSTIPPARGRRIVTVLDSIGTGGLIRGAYFSTVVVPDDSTLKGLR